MVSLSFFSYLLIIGSYVYFDLPNGAIYLTCGNEFTNVAVSGCGTIECSNAVFSYFEYENSTVVPILPVNSGNYAQYDTMTAISLHVFEFIDDNFYFFYNGTAEIPLTYFTGSETFTTKGIKPCSLVPALYSTSRYAWSYIYNNSLPISVAGSYTNLDSSLYQILIN